ncbi:MAG: DUF1704 domain-containing protein [Wenzhouxiangella sp.]|nr:MAG: DUF1704 domain-containing protein [Wenzhouxiangella sp.]
MRILGLLAWPLEVRNRFLETDGQQLPDVSYPQADTGKVDEALALARPLIARSGPAKEWFERIADRIGMANRMLHHVGQREFYHASGQLYGAPQVALSDSGRTPLDLAQRLRRIIDQLSHVDLGAPADPTATATEVAARMRLAVEKFFAEEAPAIEIVDNLSANATAGPERIRIRATARFTDRDVEQLIHHEAGIHVTTSLNGRHQLDLPILAASHPGTTRTQEGLAVFAEFITGCMDLDRLSRLADRVLGIHMAVEGADFIEVYRHFLDQLQARDGSDDADTVLAQRKAAFEQTRRVFRGGLLTGGAPFTKDVVYLDGLLRVHDFLRSVIAAGRADVLMLLFCGKLDLDDVPVLGKLADMGLLRPPRFLPGWASDRRFLVSYLAYSGFLGRVRMGQVHEHYTDLLKHVPTVRFAD